MALHVTLLTPGLIDRIEAHYPSLVANFDTRLQCALRGPVIPDKEWLKAVVTETPPLREIMVVTDGAQFVGLVVVRLADGRIEWLVPNHNYGGGWGQVATFICQTVYDRHGVAWGMVERSGVRDAMLSADARFSADGARLQWSP